MKATIVNHGNVFGTKNWHTFYCPNDNCKRQITRNEIDSRKGVHTCGQEITF